MILKTGFKQYKILKVGLLNITKVWELQMTRKQDNIFKTW